MSNNLRILYLEDNEDDVKLVGRYIRSDWTDCELENVASRQDYESALESKRFDLILADYTLPSFDGLAALDIARDRHPEIPFIFVTGTMGEDVAIEALKNGATDYVLKHTLNRLVPAVKRALSEGQEKARRKEMESQLILSSQEWRTTFDSISEGISIHNMDRQVIKLNKPLAEFLGMPLKEVLGRKCFEIFHGLNEPIADCPMSRVLISKKPEQTEFFDGRRDKWLSILCCPVLDEEGTFLNVSHIVRDITEQKREKDEIARRVEELERFRKATIQREFRIRELKARVRELETKLGNKRDPND